LTDFFVCVRSTLLPERRALLYTMRAGRDMARGDPPGAAGPSPASSSSDIPDPWWYPGKIDWTANPNRLVSSCGFYGDREEFVGVMVGLFRDAGLFYSRMLPTLTEHIAEQFFDRAFEAFKPVPYHCAFKGQETAAAAHVLLQQLRRRGHDPIDDLDALAVLLVACCGKIGHLGLTNEHLRLVNHPLCDVYPENTNERYHAHVLSHCLNDNSRGLVRCVPERDGARREFTRLIERLVLDFDPEKRHITASVFFEITSRLRARHEENDGAGYSSFENRVEENRNDLRNDLASPSASFFEGGIVNVREKTSILSMVLLCAECASLVMPLRRADFWEGRKSKELANRRGCPPRSFPEPPRRGNVRATRASTTSISGDFFETPLESLTQFAIPSFEAFGRLCDPRFTAAVARQSRRNAEAWRETLAAAEASRRRRERAVTCSKDYLDALGGFGIVAAFLMSRKSVLREKIHALDAIVFDVGIPVSSARAAAAKVARGYESFEANVETRALVSGVFFLASAALGSSRSERVVPERLREGFLAFACAWLVSVRFFVSRSRRVLMATIAEAEAELGGGEGDCFFGVEPLFRENTVVGAAFGEITRGAVVVPCVVSLVYYFVLPMIPTRMHVGIHALATFARRESAARGAGRLPPSTDFWTRASKRGAWRTVFAFPLLLLVVDWRNARRALPSAVVALLNSGFGYASGTRLFPTSRGEADAVGNPQRRRGLFSSATRRDWGGDAGFRV